MRRQYGRDLEVREGRVRTGSSKHNQAIPSLIGQRREGELAADKGRRQKDDKYAWKGKRSEMMSALNLQSESAR